MIVSKKIRDGKFFLTIVDSDLIGKKIVEDNKILDLSSKYYDGEEIGEKEVIELSKKAFCIDIVGNKSVDFAMKNNIANDYTKVKNVKHAMVFKTI